MTRSRALYSPVEWYWMIWIKLCPGVVVERIFRATITRTHTLKPKGIKPIYPKINIFERRLLSPFLCFYASYNPFGFSVKNQARLPAQPCMARISCGFEILPDVDVYIPWFFCILFPDEGNIASDASFAQWKATSVHVSIFCIANKIVN